MSDEIRIKKNNLWKAATFLLVVALAIVLIFSNVTKTTGNVSSDVDVIDLKGFLSDNSLYPSLGPEDADIVVVEFSDFQCPYCALASGLPEFASQYVAQYPDLISSAQKVQELASEGKIRFVYVSMSFLGEESVYATQAALCANEQGLFWEMHDAIFSVHDGKENNGKFSKENLKKIAQGINSLDTNEFNNCLEKDDTLVDAKKIASAASTIVSGTPSFFVNGQQVSASWNALSTAIGL